MSFILDALKKSENERQRQAGPSLADVSVRRRAADRPWWAIAVAALLVLNLGVLSTVLLRKGAAPAAVRSQVEPGAPAPSPSGTPDDPAAPAGMTAPSGPAVSVASGDAPTGAGPGSMSPGPASSGPGFDARADVRADASARSAGEPAAQRDLARLAPADPAVRSLADQIDPYYGQDFDDGAAPGPESMHPGLAAAAAVPEGPPVVRRIEPRSPAPARITSAPIGPAQAPGRTTPPGASGAADNEVLPTLSDVVARGTQLPDMHLDIHVHSSNPAERFVFVNMRKYTEGQALNEGPVVERIRTDGVVLNQHGIRFLLPRP